MYILYSLQFKYKESYSKKMITPRILLTPEVFSNRFPANLLLNVLTISVQRVKEFNLFLAVVG